MAARPRHPSASGFTIMELLVVLVVLGLAAAVTLPYLGNFRGSGLAGNARELAAGLRLARSHAVVQAQEAVLVLHLEEHTFEVGDGRVHELADDINIEVTTAKSEVEEKLARFRFFADGSSTGGNVLLSSAGRGIRVNVDWLTGRVYITE